MLFYEDDEIQDGELIYLSDERGGEMRKLARDSEDTERVFFQFFAEI